MSSRIVAPVLPTAGAIARLAPIDSHAVDLTDGFWAERRRVNRERSLPHGFHQLERAGNLDNLRLAAGAGGRYRTIGQAVGLDFPFLDSDVYKWLEAVGWEIGRRSDAALASFADEAIAAIAAAQDRDGYLNSFVQVIAPDRRYTDLAWGHELYCYGHLIQAAIAWHRALGDDRLLDIAVRAADSAERELGPAGRPGIDGHPEVEMALVELYRTTGEARYLELARTMVERRGHGLLPAGRYGRTYWQDHLPVRDAPTVAGHAVRQLYLDSGAVDVATETGDEALLAAVHHRWRDMVDRYAYLTGGLGSRHRDESFGDPYELPPDRAYAETCAAIASVMLAWRLLLATGDPACADAIERTVYNAALAGVSLDGTSFFYENPLQRRTDRAPADPGHGERAAWYPCSCCPPNLMRLLGSWPGYLATQDPGGIQVHQFAPADIRVEAAGGTVHLQTKTDYPWSGRLEITVLETPTTPWELSVRVPAWSSSASVRDAGGDERPVPGGQSWRSGSRPWASGDCIVLETGMAPRVTEPHARVDAIRGTLALERGPLVYCIETADLPAGVDLEDVSLDPSVEPVETARPDITASAMGLTIPAGIGVGDVGAIPYFAWANRSVEAMRVWIPRRSAGGDPTVTRNGGG